MTARPIAPREGLTAPAEPAIEEVVSVSPLQRSGDPATTAMIRRLLTETERSLDDLARARQQLDGTDQSARRATIALQERLRLGARMLQALDTQIRLVQTSLDDLQQREEAAQSRQRRLEHAICKLEKQVAKLTDRMEWMGRAEGTEARRR